MIPGAVLAGLIGCLVFPFEMTQFDTLCLFFTIFAEAWLILTEIDEARHRLQARRDVHKIQKGNRRSKAVDINLADQKKTLWIEETPSGKKYARWI